MLLRPRSLPGNDLNVFFSPCKFSYNKFEVQSVLNMFSLLLLFQTEDNLYIQADKPYGDMDNAFVKAQSW